MQVSEDIWEGRLHTPPSLLSTPVAHFPHSGQREPPNCPSPPPTPHPLPRPLSLFLHHHSGLTCSDGLPGGPDNLALAMFSAPDLALADFLNYTLARDLPT